MAAKDHKTGEIMGTSIDARYSRTYALVPISKKCLVQVRGQPLVVLQRCLLLLLGRPRDGVHHAEVVLSALVGVVVVDDAEPLNRDTSTWKSRMTWSRDKSLECTRV